MHLHQAQNWLLSIHIAFVNSIIEDLAIELVLQLLSGLRQAERVACLRGLAMVLHLFRPGLGVSVSSEDVICHLEL